MGYHKYPFGRIYHFANCHHIHENSIENMDHDLSIINLHTNQLHLNNIIPVTQGWTLLLKCYVLDNY